LIYFFARLATSRLLTALLLLFCPIEKKLDSSAVVLSGVGMSWLLLGDWTTVFDEPDCPKIELVLAPWFCPELFWPYVNPDPVLPILEFCAKKPVAPEVVLPVGLPLKGLEGILFCPNVNPVVPRVPAVLLFEFPKENEFDALGVLVDEFCPKLKELCPVEVVDVGFCPNENPEFNVEVLMVNSVQK